MHKNTNPNKGFTLVELLIVIVVIAILAAISIVAYNGIQDRARSSSGKTLASQIVKKAEAYNTIMGQYPANPSAFNATAAPDEATIDTSKVTQYTAGIHTVPANYDNGNMVIYRANTSGGCVFWYDYASDNTVSAKFGTNLAPCQNF